MVRSSHLSDPSRKALFQRFNRKPAFPEVSLYKNRALAELRERGRRSKARVRTLTGLLPYDLKSRNPKAWAEREFYGSTAGGKKALSAEAQAILNSLSKTRVGDVEAGPSNWLYATREAGLLAPQFGSVKAYSPVQRALVAGRGLYEVGQKLGSQGPYSGAMTTYSATGGTSLDLIHQGNWDAGHLLIPGSQWSYQSGKGSLTELINGQVRLRGGLPTLSRQLLEYGSTRGRIYPHWQYYDERYSAWTDHN